jgi:Fe-S-cluster containining protein
LAPPLPRRRSTDWRDSPERAELRSIYAEADALVQGWACGCTSAEGAASGPHCCHFSVTGREPYPTAVELEEVLFAVRASPLPARGSHARRAPGRRALPLVDRPELRPCPLLRGDGRCGIYASRPLGCRTFFCDGAEGPTGPRARLPRGELNALARRVADLSARFRPRDPLPRPITRALKAG